VSITDWVDDVADEFERAWQGVRPPRIRDFLEGIDGERRTALQAELEQIDRAYRDRLCPPGAATTRPEEGSPNRSESPVAATPTGVGGYEILGELGRGGMGVVYKALQVKLKRIVALKMIKAGPEARAKDLARFRVEAEAAARLQHPNIVQIYEVGELDGRPYFSMEFVSGGSLETQLGGVPRAARPAAQMVETLARAVQYAHERGVVHRDIKPANVLLTADRAPKITDFGLAKRLSDEPAGSTPGGATQSGDILGTPRYMAPEQAAGSTKEIGPPADVYALGALLYELLAGRPPFQGESVFEILVQVRSQEPVSPRRLQPRVPRDLETICLKAMSKSAGHRYATAGELADDLRRFSNGESIRARPVGAIHRFGRWCWRNPVLAGLAASATFALLLGTAVSTFFVAQAAARQKETEREQRNAFQHAYVADLRLAKPYWEANRVDWIRGLLARQRPEHTGGEDLRGFEWYYWLRLCQSIGSFTGHTGPIKSVAYSPDGKQLACASADRTVTIWEADGGRLVLTLRGHSESVHDVVFSPDGKWLASAGDDKAIILWDTGSGKRLRTFRGHDATINGVAFSPDGRQLASAGEDRSARIWDTLTGAELSRCSGHTGAVFSVAFSPTGKRLASGGVDQTVRLWDAESGQERKLLRGHTGFVHSVAFSPDGRSLASAGDDKAIRVWDIAGDEPARVLNGHTESVVRVAFSRDGTRLASRGLDRSVIIWDAVQARPLLRLRGCTTVKNGLAFDPDGQRVAFVGEDGTVRIWDAVRGQEPLTLSGHTKRVWGIAFSSDGRYLASAGGRWNTPGGEILLWDVASGQKLRELKGLTQAVNCVAFSPDSELLAAACDDRTVKVWEVASGALLRSLEGHEESVWCVAFGPDGSWLASASEDKTVGIWDVKSGQRLLRLTGHTDKVSGVAVSPDGRRLASAGWDRTVRMWDLPGGKESILNGHTDAVWSVAISPDGRRLASASDDGTVWVWDAATGKPLAELRGHTSRVCGVAFSPDSCRLASAGRDNLVRIWDPVGGQELLALAGHTEPVFGVAFSPDGQRLASASWDGTVKIWDARAVIEDGR
jgi:WD40 repeat protein